MTTVLTTTDTQVLQRGGTKFDGPVHQGMYVEDEVDVKEEVMEVPADKKTDQDAAAPPSGGYLWRFSSGMVSMTTGAVTGAASASVNGAKWMASTSKNVGSAIYQKVPTVSLRRKDKKE